MQIQNHCPEPRTEAHLVCSEPREGSGEGRVAGPTVAFLFSLSSPYLHRVPTAGQLVSGLATGNRIPILLDGKTEAQGRLINQAGTPSRQGWEVT